jgi:hypothetical protein
MLQRMSMNSDLGEIEVNAGEWKVIVARGLPALLDEYQSRAALSDTLQDLPRSDEGVLFVAVARPKRTGRASWSSRAAIPAQVGSDPASLLSRIRVGSSSAPELRSSAIAATTGSGSVSGGTTPRWGSGSGDSTGALC